MTSEAATALRLYVADLRHLFDSRDPAPFRERDLDPNAAEFIVDSAREASSGSTFALQVQLGRGPVSGNTVTMLSDAVHEHFERCAAGKRRELARLFRTGRVSLLIGLTFLASAFALASWVGGLITHEGYAWLVSESLIIGGWVALWRPMEIFLYDWWPIRADANLFDRLATMPVSLSGADAAAESAT